LLDAETWGQLDRYESEMLSTISDVYSGEAIWDDGVSRTNAEAGDRFVDQVAEEYPVLRALAPRIKADGRRAAAAAAERRNRQLPDEHSCSTNRLAHTRCHSCNTLCCNERQCACPRSKTHFALPRVFESFWVLPKLDSLPRPTLSEYVDVNGVVHREIPGAGMRPVTHFGGIEVRDTTIGGLPRQDPSPGRQAARTVPGTPITGQGGRQQFQRPFG
jgi:hypothetical protein